jgi:hypothetical protein
LSTDSGTETEFHDGGDRDDALDADRGTRSTASTLGGSRASLSRARPSSRSLRAFGPEDGASPKDRCARAKFNDLPKWNRADYEDGGTFGRTLPGCLTETAVSDQRGAGSALGCLRTSYGTDCEDSRTSAQFNDGCDAESALSESGRAFDGLGPAPDLSCALNACDRPGGALGSRSLRDSTGRIDSLTGRGSRARARGGRAEASLRLSGARNLSRSSSSSTLSSDRCACVLLGNRPRGRTG